MNEYRILLTILSIIGTFIVIFLILTVLQKGILDGDMIMAREELNLMIFFIAIAGFGGTITGIATAIGKENIASLGIFISGILTLIVLCIDFFSKYGIYNPATSKIEIILISFFMCFGLGMVIGKFKKRFKDYSNARRNKRWFDENE